jgi:cyclophilin family peptidyl-prolyl cis-trans isomerase
MPARGQTAATVRPTVVIETSLGDITVELDPEKAPITVDNFLKYVRAGFYDGTIFHRVIDGFMAQGGGYTREMDQKTPLYPAIPLEARNGLKNQRGTVAMARSRAPDSATCQFFVNLVDNPFLDYNPTTNPAGYAVFGRVVSGWETLDRLGKVKVGPNPADIQPDGTQALSLPVTPVTIRTIRRVGAAEPAGRSR